MSNKALIVIDIQNDITKHYREIIDTLNASIDWATENGMTVVYIKHNNLSPGTRTFKPDTKGTELVPELKIVSDHIFVKTKANALTSEAFSEYIRITISQVIHWMVLSAIRLLQSVGERQTTIGSLCRISMKKTGRGCGAGKWQKKWCII